MSKQVKPYKKDTSSKKEQVSKMFNAISKQYDKLNRVISFGFDVKWRKKVVNMVVKAKPQNILDVATGTGDLAISLAKANVASIIGIDISAGMLDYGTQKIEQKKLDKRVNLELGDCEQLKFADNTFDAVTVAFGIRNFENLEQGLSEILRVLKPKGLFVILETSVPNNAILRFGYKIYTRYILPTIGRVFSKDKVAYKYLCESASTFPYGETLNNILLQIGFNKVNHYPQTLGVATIYEAYKS